MESQYNISSKNVKYLTELVTRLPSKVRRPGRPRAIPKAIEPIIIDLHKKGYGPQAISKILLQGKILIHWSTIRRFIKGISKEKAPMHSGHIQTHLGRNPH